ncbi:MAG: hypothetical protein K8R90_09795, partial [Candidatus Cloacimonetes bacterium]|nr:hypothetical protein [Candidatus Cloacimonadota bacterium]
EYQSTFMVMYHFELGYFASEPMAGYSADNIAPYTTGNVRASISATRNDVLTLTWDEVTEGSYQGNSYPEQNGIWYRVHSGDNPDFTCDETTLLTTTQDLTLDVDITSDNRLFFKVVVSDQP